MEKILVNEETKTKMMSRKECILYGIMDVVSFGMAGLMFSDGCSIGRDIAANRHYTAKYSVDVRTSAFKAGSLGLQIDEVFEERGEIDKGDLVRLKEMVHSYCRLMEDKDVVAAMAEMPHSHIFSDDVFYIAGGVLLLYRIRGAIPAIRGKDG